MKLFVAIIALAFFCLPVGLRAVGITAEPFENRRLAEAPDVTAGWDAFDQATAFFVDRLPLREQAVRANTWISLNVFDTPPDYGGRTAGGAPERDALPFGEPETAAAPPPATAPPPASGQATQVQPGVTVLRGRDGWLFLEEEFQRACVRFIEMAAAVDRYERMVEIIRSSGRRALFIVPPDKSTIYTEFLPGEYANKDCAGPGREELWAAVEGRRSAGILPLRTPMLAVKQPPPDHTYYPNDTHWNTKGATLAVGEVLDALGGRARLRRDEVVETRVKAAGDLANLLGAPEELESPQWDLRRAVAPAAAAKEPLPNGGVQDLSTRPTGGGPLVRGRTVLLYDSFGVGMIGALQAYSEELATVQWFGAGPADLIEAIARGDTVLLEKVERDINFLASDGGIVTEQFLADLKARLRQDRR